MKLCLSPGNVVSASETHIATRSANSAWRHENGFIKFVGVRFMDIKAVTSLIVLDRGEVKGALELYE